MAKLQAKQDTIIYDTVRIGPAVPDQYPGVIHSFTELADAEEVAFFDSRSTSNGLQYCNLISKGPVGNNIKIYSFGIRFVYPTPNVDSVSPFGMRRESAKLFEQIIPEHCYLYVEVGDDRVVRLKPHMLPPGYGPQGFISREDGNTAGNFSMIASNGVPIWGARYPFTGAMLDVPEGTPWKAVIGFGSVAKTYLKALGDVEPIVINDGDPIPDEALIEMTGLGLRYIPPRGSNQITETPA